MARRHYRPFVKTVASTLWASSAIVVRDLLGRLQPQDVDDIMHRWADQVYENGEGTLTTIGAEQYAAARPHDGVAGRAYVVMTNHQSLLDVPSVVRSFPGRVRMVGKRELSRLPVWGHAMRASGIVFVDRSDRGQSIAALELAKTQLQGGTSIWIAPEGTRNHGDELGPLKKGGFHLARQLGVPIAPAWIEGTRHIVSPDSFGVHLHGSVSVRWGAPIDTSDVDEAGLPALMERVRASLLELQAKSRAQP